MSKQSLIKIPVTGGHWELRDHYPKSGDAIKYSARLSLVSSADPICHVFALKHVEIDDGCLVLDSTHIYLGDHVDAVDQFLLDTGGYDGETNE
ncbi:hypothetical protein [Cellvibrio sp. PSBB023]|uniref:hypothetical protein n=1 Tax=Cellvibrio sp. PSBB023 TaxID=1945512 RepID=UPI00098FE794|nr:hypothetical protein [Cellvibrio sp. PSBB023]AQT58699.1 hypothetical protein B0D95_00265 [Cellvibrio sp. PSBB023]